MNHGRDAVDIRNVLGGWILVRMRGIQCQIHCPSKLSSVRRICLIVSNASYKAIMQNRVVDFGFRLGDMDYADCVAV